MTRYVEISHLITVRYRGTFFRLCSHHLPRGYRLLEPHGAPAITIKLSELDLSTTPQQYNENGFARACGGDGGTCECLKVWY